MLQRFLNYIAEQHLFTPGQEVLLAVSGGRDSVTLCHLMHSAGYPFAIAHCNFHLRPGDCDRDEAFVRQLAQHYEVKCYVAQFHTREMAARNKLSIEEEARKERYAFFARLLHEEGYPCIATAHHSDDSIETFFINLLRGTGIAGLHGIRPRSAGPQEMTDISSADLSPQEMPSAHRTSSRHENTGGEGQRTSSPGRVVHPLLCFSRAEIDTYVQEHNLTFVEDYTNHQLDYRRNQIRLQLMPLLRQLSPNFDRTMAANIEHIADAEQVYRQAIERTRTEIVHEDPFVKGLFHIATSDILALNPRRTLMYELLSPFGFSLSIVDDLLVGLSHNSSQQFFSATHRLSKERDMLTIEPLASLPDTRQHFLLPILQADAKGDTLLIPALKLQWDVGIMPHSPFDKQQWKLPKEQACFDLSQLKQPLLLRHWHEGDKFQPFGMTGFQLISDYLSDHKFSRRQKESVWLLCDADGEILWIVGHRASRHASLTANTQQTVLFTSLSTQLL